MTAYFILFILFSIISLVCIYFVDKVTYINDIIFCSSVALLLIFGLTAAFKSYREKEQQKIAAVLSTADQGITVLQQKLAALKQEKQALMQQLLTGKRRVKVEEAA